MLASLLLSGLVLAEPGGTISYHKKVMIDPDYRPSRTPDQIETALRRARVTRPVVAERVAPQETAYRTVAVRSVYEEPRVSWNVGLSYDGWADGWGARVGVGYGYPTTYGYAYRPYAYSSYGSPWSWAIGLGYATSWGYLGLGYSSGWGCGPGYYGSSHGYGGRRSYRSHRR